MILTSMKHLSAKMPGAAKKMTFFAKLRVRRVSAFKPGK